MTARDLINSSLRLIGVLASGETCNANEAVNALARLNGMIKSWGVDGLMVFKVTREEFALSASQASRTMGSGGNFNTTRPVKILRVGVEDGTTEIPVEIITAEQWADISDKSTTATNPTKVYIEGTYPLETINLWPIPTDTNNLVIYSQKPILSTLALSDSISVPDGYEEALEYNLAVRLAPEFGKPMDQLVYQEAMDLKLNLMRQNTKPVYASSDAATLLGCDGYNILTGE